MITNKEAAFFDSIAGSWDATRNPVPRILQLLLNKAMLSPHGNILDVGSGTGVLIPYLQNILCQDKSKPIGKIVAIDSSERMLSIAQQKYKSWSNIQFVSQNVMTASLPEASFSSITCLNVFPHLKGYQQEFLARCQRLLAPGGKVAIMHDISRRDVNGIHATSDEVADHRLPAVTITSKMMKQAGLQVCQAEETDEYYIVVGRRIY